MSKKVILIFIINAAFCFSQENKSSVFSLKTYFNKLNNFEVNNVINEINKAPNSLTKKQLNIYYKIFSINGFKKHQSYNYVNTIAFNTKNDNVNLCLNYLIKARHELLYENNRIKAYHLLSKGYSLSKKINNKAFKKEFLKRILEIYKLGVVVNDKNIENYLTKFKEICDNDYCLLNYHIYKIYLNQIGVLKNDSDEKKSNVLSKTNISFNKIDKIITTVDKKSLSYIEYLHLKGLHYLSTKTYKTALKYFYKEAELLKEKKAIFFNKYKYNVWKEIARTYTGQKQYKKALENLKKAKKFENTINKTKNKFVYNLYISDIYNGLGKKNAAFNAMKSAFHQSLFLNFKNQNNLISSLEIKNRTTEKEKENLILKQKNIEAENNRKKNKNLFIASLTFLILSMIIGFLMLKNSRKKRQLAEQQKEIEKQKNITLLKEQEINAINAMIAGQEKERKEISEDLHDNIGSVLATLKLNFENLKLNRTKKEFNQDELYKKTENLIDETYLKIRSIAHAKNAGVIANEGLLVAVKLMAEKISSANKINIEVINFGLKNRIKNTLEITVFRIIQELVTNIIKHANAKNTSINISQFNDNLNIIIDDDGKGFNYKKLNLKDGMGLKSIKKRIEYLNGTFEIDSSLGNGTCSIINIPLE